MKIHVILHEGYDEDVNYSHVVGAFSTRQACEDALLRLKKIEYYDEAFTRLVVEVDDMSYIEAREQYAEEFENERE